MNLLSKKKISIALIALLLVGGLGFWVFTPSFRFSRVQQLDGIVDFDYQRDREFILELFNKNWYWLIEEDTPSFSPDYMMRYLTTSNSPSTAGQLTLKVLYEHGKHAGFAAYYMKHFYLGQIRFIAVSEAFRSKGYGRKLVDYALNDLHSRGAAKVTLLTRTSNIPAQKSYTACGMRKYAEEDGFVWFEKVF